MEILIQPLTCSLATLAAYMEILFSSTLSTDCFPLSAQRRWTPTTLLSSMRAPRGAWGCGITPSSFQPPVRKSTSAGSGWPGVACSTWALRCAWAWPLATTPPDGTGLLWVCTPVTVSPPEYAGPGTVARCWTVSTTTFPHPHFGTPPQPPLLQRSNGHCMVVCRTCALKHTVVSMLVMKQVQIYIAKILQIGC